MNQITTTVKELEQAEQDALVRVQEWSIGSNLDYSALDSYCRGLLVLKKKIVEDFRDSKAAAKTAHQTICDQESAHLDKVEDAIKLGKGKLHIWSEAQEKLRREEEDRLRAEAKKKADEDALKAAEAAQKAGDAEGAEVIIEEAAAAPAPVVVLPSATPKRQTVIRMVKKFRIVAPGAIKREYMTPDSVKIGGVVRSMGKAAEQMVGGIDVFEVPS
ncbi:MAG: hypothetical protein V1912_02860 [bacterium]